MLRRKEVPELENMMKYGRKKYDLKPTARANYKYCFDRYMRDGFE